MGNCYGSYSWCTGHVHSCVIVFPGPRLSSPSHCQADTTAGLSPRGWDPTLPPPLPHPWNRPHATSSYIPLWSSDLQHGNGPLLPLWKHLNIPASQFSWRDGFSVQSLAMLIVSLYCLHLLLSLMSLPLLPHADIPDCMPWLHPRAFVKILTPPHIVGTNLKEACVWSLHTSWRSIPKVLEGKNWELTLGSSHEL